MRSSEPFVGQIALFPFNFAPQGWAFCNGQLLQINQYNALFALLGTTYGGNGQTTFALPDLRGRVPLGAGQGPGLTNRFLGETLGTENVTILESQMPAHTHGIQVLSSPGTSNTPVNSIPAQNRDGISNYASGTPNGQMASGVLASTGGSQPVNNMQPSLSMNYCIALFGIFPSQS